MLSRFEPYVLPFDQEGEYYTAAVDENGAQALVYAALARSFEVADGHKKAGIEGYLLDIIGLEPEETTPLTGTLNGWEKIEKLAGGYGNDVRTAGQYGHIVAGSAHRGMVWPERLRHDIRQVGAWATGLSLEIRLERQAIERAAVQPNLFRGDFA